MRGRILHPAVPRYKVQANEGGVQLGRFCQAALSVGLYPIARNGNAHILRNVRGPLRGGRAVIGGIVHGKLFLIDRADLERLGGGLEL